MVETEDLQQLIAACSLNHRPSQEKLYKQFYVSLFCLCRRFFPNDHEAIEVVNDGMLKVFQQIGSYREGKGRFFNWVYTIVRNTAIDKFRKEVSIPAIDPASLEEVLTEESIGGNPARLLEGMDLVLLFEELTPAPRGICTLFYLEGYKITEIAEALGISTGTVKWHLSECRKKLKPFFEKYINQ
jgi:RNA polymerase sigma factor (sigma-70 family)